MDDGNKQEIKKKIDESWKETVSKERGEEKKDNVLPIEASFNVFVTGLMMEALIALGEVDNPVTKKKEVNMTHAKFVIDTISMLKDKTKNNLAKDESDMLESMLYDLRMRFVNKSR